MGKIVSGFFDRRAQKKAAKRAENFQREREAAAAARIDRLTDEQIARNTSYLENWERIFGPIEENISAYLQNLNPEVVASRQFAAIEEQYAQTVSQTKQNFAKRFGPGVTASGLAEAGELNAQLSSALIRARVKAGAEQQVFQQRAQVYGQVVGQRQSARGAIDNAYATGKGANVSATPVNIPYPTTSLGGDIIRHGEDVFRKVIGATTGNPALLAGTDKPTGRTTTLTNNTGF